MMPRSIQNRILCLLLALVLLTAIIPLPSARAEDDELPFTDVSKTGWYYDSVLRAYQSHLFDGVTATEFRPHTPMNRAMLVTVLYRMEGEPKVSDEADFTDLKADWYRPAVAWASGLGIVDGYPDGSFKPLAPVTREQIAVMLFRYAAAKHCPLTQPGGLERFPDASNCHQYAYEALCWTVRTGLIGGVKTVGADRLMPQVTASRAQVAAMLCRLQDHLAAVGRQDAAPDASHIRLFTTSPSTTLRTRRSNSADKLVVPYMTELWLMGTYASSAGGAWLKVEYHGRNYFLWQSSGSKLTTETRSSFTYATSTSYQQQLVSLVMDIYWNWPTKYAHWQSKGVPDLDGYYGFDCSGFAAYALDTVMQRYAPVYDVSANLKKLFATDGLLNQGYAGELSAKFIIPPNKPLDDSVLQPGDILFFDLADENEDDSDEPVYNHCGIYLGHNEFIHSTHSWGGGVCIMPLAGIYREHFVALKRFLPTRLTPANHAMVTTSQKAHVYPRKDSDALPDATLPAETQVTVLYADAGNWAYVRYNGSKTGCVLKKYLAEIPEEVTDHRFVCRPSIKLYTDHTTNSDYVFAYFGDAVEYAGRYSNSSYYKVDFGVSRYYVYAPDGLDALLTDQNGLDERYASAKSCTLRFGTALRDLPFNSAAQLRLLTSGEVVQIIAASAASGRSWCYIRTQDGDCGYAYLEP